MTIKKQSIGLLKRVVVACFLAVTALFGTSVNTIANEAPVYAVEESESSSSSATEENKENSVVSTPEGDSDSECKKSFGAIGWLVCPATGKIAEAVDFLYGTLENLLVVEPIKIEDGTPIYEIWKYCRGLTNIIFIIMLLIVIYSQITGLGISNYGIKKALPRLIVAAILINLSFIICSLLVDASNIAGNGIRGVFSSIAESATPADSASLPNISAVGIFGSVAIGGTLTVLGVDYALATGLLFMLVPTLVGMLVSILIGLFTIALRQAVVALLVMIAPLAFVANILPNTENLFQKWKNTLIQMLVFYPMFSLLFGASNLAGFAIVASADSAFGVLLGVIVQVLPLIFSWNLMKMSDSILGRFNNWAHGMTAGPLAGLEGWAAGRAALKRQKSIAEGNRFRPALALMRFTDSRKARRDLETNEFVEYNRNRAAARHANSHYRRDGTVSRKGEKAYRRQAEISEFQQEVLRDKNNFDSGLGHMGRGKRQTLRLESLDVKNIKAADSLQLEQTRSEWIKRDNTRGYYKRLEEAEEAKLREDEGYITDPRTGKKTLRPGFDFSDPKHIEAMARYNTMFQIMDNDERATEYAVAVAASNNIARANVIGKEMYTRFKDIPSAKDLRAIISNLSNTKDAAEHMDVILPGFRVLNDYRDLDVIRDRIKDITRRDAQHDGLTLGTHAAQSLASFLMFEASDKDPMLKKFGNYINGETFRLYESNNPRRNRAVTYDEYVLGYYYEEDPNNPGHMKKTLPKRGASELLVGTTFDDIERAGFENYENSIIDVFTSFDQHGNKQIDMEGYLKRKQELDDAILPAFVAANMKYVTGSDQLAGSIRLKTGYLTKRDPNTGKPYTVPIWEDESTLRSYGMLGHEEELRKFYQMESIKYAGTLSPNQIFALRTAYREPLTRHFSDAFMESDMRGWSDEEKAERGTLMDEFRKQQEILANSQDVAEKEEARIRLSNLREEMASTFFRRTLRDHGTLTQIYSTRKSGAANNAKEWVVRWLKLNDAEEIRKAQGQKKRSQSSTQQANSGNTQYVPIGTYSSSDMDTHRDRMRNLYQNMPGATIDELFDAMKDRTRQVFGDAVTVTLEDFEKYHKKHQASETPEGLIDKLIELLTRDLI